MTCYIIVKFSVECCRVLKFNPRNLDLLRFISRIKIQLKGPNSKLDYEICGLLTKVFFVLVHLCVFQTGKDSKRLQTGSRFSELLEKIRLKTLESPSADNKWLIRTSFAWYWYMLFRLQLRSTIEKGYSKLFSNESALFQLFPKLHIRKVRWQLITF